MKTEQDNEGNIRQDRAVSNPVSLLYIQSHLLFNEFTSQLITYNLKLRVFLFTTNQMLTRVIIFKILLSSY